MLVTNQLCASPRGGRELLCKLNHDAIREIYGDQLVLFELPRRQIHNLGQIVNAFRGHIDGLNDNTIEEALETAKDQKIAKIFIDGSNLGEFAKAAKQRLQQVQVITFFHNVEARFFFGALRQSKTLHALAVLAANFLSERKSVRYSDKIVCLSARDSCLLRKLYGRAATHISSIAVKDGLLPAQHLNKRPVKKTYALFVGGAFYANRAGIAWYVQHVVPRISIKTCIVGRGFEDLRSDLERDGKVEIIGTVDDLTQWYLNAFLVIAPIFDGSGMKTKVAEALMYGKRIIGTPEAFSGYEDVADRAGWVCTTADEFVAAFGRTTHDIRESVDPSLRALYAENYSVTALKMRLAKILESN